MWVFFAIVSAGIVAVVALLLHRFPLKSVPFAVRSAVACAWLTSIAIIAFIPVDVWATLRDKDVYPIYIMWEISYWSTQFLTWVGIPLFMGYVDAGDFTVLGRIQSSLRDNLVFYSILITLSVFGLIFVMSAQHLSFDALPGFCIALTNMFGLTVVVFLLGYGLVSVPRSLWRLSNPEAQLKQSHYNIGKQSKKVEDAIAEMKRVNVVLYASEQQMSRRDKLTPFLNIVKAEFNEMKPTSIELDRGRDLSEHVQDLTAEELDYALDMKGLTDLRRRIRNAANRFEGMRVEYVSTIEHALSLSEICKRRKNSDYSSDMSSGRRLPLYWFTVCVLNPIARCILAIIFGAVSVIVIWSELVIVGERTYLSPIHVLMKSAKKEWALYTVILIPLVYMFYCTYHTLFNLAAFRFYHLIPKASPSYSLLLNGSLMCRFAAPLAYNFLHVIQVIKNESDNSTAFSKVMGSMRVLPFFGQQFNSWLPIFLLIHCILITFDVWKKLHYQFLPANYQYCEDETDDDNSRKGRLLLFKEQDAIEEGKEIGEILGIDAQRNLSTSSPTKPASQLPSNSQRASLDTPLAHVEEGPTNEGVEESDKRSMLDNVFASVTGSTSRTQLSTREDNKPHDAKTSVRRWLQK